jgi:hypothetical protein
MRKPYQLLFALLGVLMIALPASVFAQDTEEMTNGMPEYRQFVSKASRLRTSDVNDPDTVWIGHIADASWRPKTRTAQRSATRPFRPVATDPIASVAAITAPVWPRDPLQRDLGLRSLRRGNSGSGELPCTAG